jgi:GMP synthase (glutamine-hydrolysing)
MNIHYLQHEAFEDLASISKWVNKPENTITCTKFFEKNFVLPNPDTIDLLIVLGGPMGVYDEKEYPWLKSEKKFIGEMIKRDKKILGICLGAQLIAEVLGSKVYKNHEKEIGWFDVELSPDSKNDFYFNNFPDKLKVFHWHGDTFDLPTGATRMASSICTMNQAYTYQKNIVALQFHIEATQISVSELIKHCKEELVDGKFIQKEPEIIKDAVHLEKMNSYMFQLLDKMKS